MEKAKEIKKTMIGGQALIEGIMMRGPDTDAIVIRNKEGITVETAPRKHRKKGSFATWPFVRGVVNFFDSQVTGVKALMRSADLSPDEEDMPEEPSKLDLWLEKKLGSEKFQKAIVGFSVVLGVGISVVLFILLPSFLAGFLSKYVSPIVQNLIEGLLRIVIFTAYMFLVSRMKEMRRVFSYHGAEHKTIRCYEAGLELTVENVRPQTRLHPRCGTSFLLVVMILSILLFSVATTVLLDLFPWLAALRGKSFAYNLIMMGCKLLMLPILVAIAYECNRLVGKYDNLLTRILSAPGMWFQYFTTNEPDDEMIEVGIASLKAVIPDEEGADAW